MFTDNEEDLKLKEVKRQKNDFSDFYDYERKNPELSILNTTKNNTSSLKILPSSNQMQLKNIQENQRYVKEEKIDQFLSKYITGKSYTSSERIDNFLATKKDWASQGKLNPIQQVMHDKYMQDPEYSTHYNFQTKNSLNCSKNNTSLGLNSTQNRSILDSNNNNTTLKSLGQNTTQFASYSFSGPPRFWLSKNSNKSGNFEFNSLVFDSTQQGNNPRYLDKKINKKIPINYDQEKLFKKPEPHKDLETKDERETELSKLMKSPRQIKKDMEVLRNQKEKYQEWKKEKGHQMKQLNLLKNSYKSGILSVDGPFVQDSVIYKKEHEQYKKKEEYINRQRQERVKNIEKFTLTNPAVGFYNLNHKRYDSVPNTKRDFPSQSHTIDPVWKSKKVGKNLSQVLPTFQNCFGHNLADQKQSINNPRSKHLRQQDVRQKNFNPLTGVRSPKLFDE